MQSTAERKEPTNETQWLAREGGRAPGKWKTEAKLLWDSTVGPVWGENWLEILSQTCQDLIKILRQFEFPNL